MQPLVSVIVTCLNSARFLPHAVNCTLSQTYKNIECIIVDDGSTDNTCAIAESLMQQDSRIKFVSNTGNHGPAGARNFGVRHARGEWIQFYDVDDHLYPDKIRLQLDYLTDNDNHTDDDVVIYSDFEVNWETKDGIVERTMTNKVGAHPREALMNKIMSWSNGPTMPFQVGSMLFKRRIFNDKLFNENLMMFEEIELFTDLLHKHIPFIYVPTVAMTYRIHDSNTTRDYRGFVMGYIQFLEEAFNKDPELVQAASTRMNIEINHAMKGNDWEIIEKIIALIKKTKIPIQFKWKGINLSNPYLLQLLFYRKRLSHTRQLQHAQTSVPICNH